MINLQNVSITTDGQHKRLNISWDIIDDNGKIISSNNRISRIVIDEEALSVIDDLEVIATGIIEQEG